MMEGKKMVRKTCDSSRSRKIKLKNVARSIVREKFNNEKMIKEKKQERFAAYNSSMVILIAR